MAGSNKRIRVNESATFGVIVAGLEVIEPGLSVVYIATIPQRVIFADGIGAASGGGENVAPGIVSITDNLVAGLVDDTHHIALQVSDVIVGVPL